MSKKFTCNIYTNCKYRAWWVTQSVQICVAVTQSRNRILPATQRSPLFLPLIITCSPYPPKVWAFNFGFFFLVATSPQTPFSMRCILLAHYKTPFTIWPKTASPFLCLLSSSVTIHIHIVLLPHLIKEGNVSRVCAP